MLTRNATCPLCNRKNGTYSKRWDFHLSRMEFSITLNSCAMRAPGGKTSNTDRLLLEELTVDEGHDDISNGTNMHGVCRRRHGMFALAWTAMTLVRVRWLSMNLMFCAQKSLDVKIFRVSDGGFWVI